MAMASLEGQVGARYVQDGTENIVRTTRTGELAKSEAHGRYFEAVSRGNCYTAANTGTRTTSTASATATGLILTNPAGSGRYLVLIDIAVGLAAAVSAAAEIGLFANFAAQTQAAVTHTTPIAVQNCLVGYSGVGVGLVDSAATLPAAPTHIRTLLATGWVNAQSQTNEFIKDEVAGAIVLTPNTCVSIQSVVSTQTIIASMTWEEVII